jgi:hypothetical protein
VRTFLITDIRGYTRYTSERGDEAAAELASTFAEIVRRVVEERDGRLIELRGDEALVVFDSARQALRSAVELLAQVAEAQLPRGIGIGLDSGEAVPVADGYRGGALNLAAAPLLTRGPRRSARERDRAPARARSRGHSLRRAPARARERAREAHHRGRGRAGRLARTAWDPHRLRRLARRTMRRRSVRVSAAAGVAAAAAAVAAALLVVGSGSAAHQIAQQSIGFVSPTGKVEGQVPVNGSGALAVLGQTLWFGNGGDKTVERVDLQTRKLVHPFASVDSGIAAMTAGFGAVWVVDGIGPRLLRVDPRYLTIRRIPLPGDKGDIDFTAMPPMCCRSRRSRPARQTLWPGSQTRGGDTDARSNATGGLPLHPVQHGARPVHGCASPPRGELRDRPPRARVHPG